MRPARWATSPTSARSLRTRSSAWSVGWSPDVSNPLNGTIVRAAEAHLRDAGYMLIIANTANDPGRESAAAGQFGTDASMACWWRQAAAPIDRMWR